MQIFKAMLVDFKAMFFTFKNSNTSYFFSRKSYNYPYQPAENRSANDQAGLYDFLKWFSSKTMAKKL